MANFQLFQNNESKHFSCGLILRKFLRKTSMMGLFSKVVCVQCPGCYSSTKRLNHIFFPEYISRSGRFKKNVFRKKSMVGQGFGRGPGVQSP